MKRSQWPLCLGTRAAWRSTGGPPDPLLGAFSAEATLPSPRPQLSPGKLGLRGQDTELVLKEPNVEPNVARRGARGGSQSEQTGAAWIYGACTAPEPRPPKEGQGHTRPCRGGQLTNPSPDPLRQAACGGDPAVCAPARSPCGVWVVCRAGRRGRGGDTARGTGPGQRPVGVGRTRAPDAGPR